MKIILTLTTVPNRLFEERDGYGTKEGLLTILKQSHQPYEVNFNIPASYGELPQWLINLQTEYKHLKVFRTEDYGPVTKLLPTLERGGDPSDIIITVDDDLYYTSEVITGHLKGRAKYPGCVVGFAGLDSISQPGNRFITSLPEDHRVKIIEGYKSVSYLRGFFDVADFKENFALKVWQDDHAISAYMGYKNIHKMVLANTYDDDYRPRVQSYPVLDHTKIEAGGCRVFRDENNQDNEAAIQNFYRLGYLNK